MSEVVRKPVSVRMRTMLRKNRGLFPLIRCCSDQATKCGLNRRLMTKGNSTSDESSYITGIERVVDGGMTQIRPAPPLARRPKFRGTRGE
jgi:hypothetical protein